MDGLIYFRNGRKGEDILLHDQSFHLPVGGLISDILDLVTDEACTHLNSILLFLNGILGKSSAVTELHYLQKKINQVPLSPILKHLILWQPFLIAQGYADANYEAAAFTPAEKSDGFGAHRSPYLTDQIAAQRGTHISSWFAFSAWIDNRPTLSLDTKDQLDMFHHCLHSYCEHFDETILELRRLKQLLNEAFYGTPENRSSNTTHLRKICCQASIALNPPNDFPLQNKKKQNQVYAAIRISQLVGLEFIFLDEISRHFSRCSICNRHFIPYKKSSTYCQNPNPTYDGRRCCDIGPMLNYQSRVKDLPLQKNFERNAATYRKWCRENRESQPKEIQDEISKIFKEWCQQIPGAQAAVQNGSLSVDKLKAIIAIPAIPERSKLLYEKRQDERRMNGLE